MLRGRVAASPSQRTLLRTLGLVRAPRRSISAFIQNYVEKHKPRSVPYSNDPADAHRDLAAYFERLEQKLDLTRQMYARSLPLTQRILLTHADNPTEIAPKTVAVRPARIALHDAAAPLALMQMQLQQTATGTATGMLSDDDVPVSIHCDRRLRRLSPGSSASATLGSSAGAQDDHGSSNAGQANTMEQLENELLTDFLTTSARQRGMTLWPPHSGLLPHVALEHYAFPSGLLFSSCEQVARVGALGMLSLRVSAADAATAAAGAPVAVPLPRVLLVRLLGKPRPWVTGKDVALAVLAALRHRGANGFSVEFAGDGVSALSLEDMATICATLSRADAVSALFPFTPAAESYLTRVGRGDILPVLKYYQRRLLEPDTDHAAAFSDVVTVQLDTLSPRTNGPHVPHQSWSLGPTVRRSLAARGYPAELGVAVIGGAEAGGIDDMRVVTDLVRQARRAELGFRSPVFVVPGSASVRSAMDREGLTATLESAGARVLDSSLTGAGMRAVEVLGALALRQGKALATTDSKLFPHPMDDLVRGAAQAGEKRGEQGDTPKERDKEKGKLRGAGDQEKRGTLEGKIGGSGGSGVDDATRPPLHANAIDVEAVVDETTDTDASTTRGAATQSISTTIDSATATSDGLVAAADTQPHDADPATAAAAATPATPATPPVTVNPYSLITPTDAFSAADSAEDAAAVAAAATRRATEAAETAQRESDLIARALAAGQDAETALLPARPLVTSVALTSGASRVSVYHGSAASVALQALTGHIGVNPMDAKLTTPANGIITLRWPGAAAGAGEALVLVDPAADALMPLLRGGLRGGPRRGLRGGEGETEVDAEEEAEREGAQAATALATTRLFAMETWRPLPSWPWWDRYDMPHLPVLGKLRGVTHVEHISPSQGPWRGLQGNVTALLPNTFLYAQLDDRDSGAAARRVAEQTAEREAVPDVSADVTVADVSSVDVGVGVGVGDNRDSTPKQPPGDSDSSSISSASFSSSSSSSPSTSAALVHSASLSPSSSSSSSSSSSALLASVASTNLPGTTIEDPFSPRAAPMSPITRAALALSRDAASSSSSSSSSPGSSAGRWVLIADELYGDGRAHDTAAVQVRALGAAVVVARSFHPDHELALKRQGILPFTFHDPHDYDRISTNDTVSVLDIMHRLLPDKSPVIWVHPGGGRDPGAGEPWMLRVRHTMTPHHITWFRCGSAANAEAEYERRLEEQRMRGVHNVQHVKSLSRFRRLWRKKPTPTADPDKQSNDAASNR